MNYARDELDGAMIISKTLTKSDIVGNVALPKAQVMSVLTRMNGVTDEGLDNGFEVQVHDIMEDDLYTVTLKRIDDMKYYFGTGWSTMKHSLDLVEGDVLKLYWDQFENKFIVLNFQHKTMGIMIPV
ncbi:putative B3 domain-containing protein [Arabidopsis thaliana]